MVRIHTDLSRLPISVAPSPATSGTTLGVTDANAALLPDTYPFWAVLVPVSVAPTRVNSEIVKVTGGSSSGGTTTYTIVRAQGVPVTTAQTVTTSFDIYDANSVEALPQVSSEVTEVPSGTMNGSNTTFTISNTPGGAIKLFHNRTYLKLTDDYTISGTTITLVSAPVSGDALVAIYDIVAGQYSVGSTSFQPWVVPSGLVNGSNTVFTAPTGYVAGTLEADRDGQGMTSGGEDFSETSASAGTFTFTTAPATGTRIRCKYQLAISTVGNADTLDGYHANATPTANNIPVLDSNHFLPTSGLSFGGAWTSWTPTFTNFTKGSATIAAYYVQIGKLVIAKIRVILAANSSVSGSLIFSLPVTANTNVAYPLHCGRGGITDAGTNLYGATGYIDSTTCTINVVNNSGTYETYTATSSTVPITWTTSDEFEIQITYEAA